MASDIRILISSTPTERVLCYHMSDKSGECLPMRMTQVD